ncbi:MAG: zinc-dependent metalloprotease family protein [Actinomycetota bacterium]
MRAHSRRWVAATGVAATVAIGCTALAVGSPEPTRGPVGGDAAAPTEHAITSTRDVDGAPNSGSTPTSETILNDVAAAATDVDEEPTASVGGVTGDPSGPTTPARVAGPDGDVAEQSTPTPFEPAIASAEPLADPAIDVPADEPVAHGPTAAEALATSSPSAVDQVASNAALPSEALIDELRRDPLLFVGRDGMLGSIEPIVGDDAHHHQHHHQQHHHHGDHAHGDGQGDEHEHHENDVQYAEEVAANDAVEAAAAPSSADALALHSRPSARRSIYLDLDGHRVEDEWWNRTYDVPGFDAGPYDIDGDPSTFSTTERNRIIEIWERVADDYAPFDVNVTTEDPGVEALRRTSSNDDRYGTRVVITSTDWYLDARGKLIGGIALINVFSSSSDHSAFVFAGNLSRGAAKPISDAVSHESGHNFGLLHDGSPAGGYYRGHGQWGPIMGAPYGRAITHWSAGAYPAADNNEDDLALIAAHTGFVPDDHDVQRPTPLASGRWPGLLHHPDDVDAFELQLEGAAASISVQPERWWSNVHAGVVVRDDTGAIVAETEPTEAIDWRIDIDVPAGRRSVTIEVTTGDWLTPGDGFVRYGALGAYDVVVEVGDPVDPPDTTTSTTTTSTTSTSTTSTSTTSTSTTSTTTPTPTTPTSGSSTSTSTTTAPVDPTTTTTSAPLTVPVGPVTPAPPTAALGGFVPLEPLRIADSRTGQRVERLAPRVVQPLAIAGEAGIPSDALAVSANVTVVGADRTGFVAVYRCRDGAPEVSSLNVRPGRPMANQTITALDDRGRLCLYSTVRGDVIVDLTGFFSPDGNAGLFPIRPVRLLDTRDDRPISPGQAQRVDVLGQPGVRRDATAAVLNIASVRPATDGWIRIVPCGIDGTDVSTLNTASGRVVTNAAIVPLSDDGAVCVESNRAGEVVVDLTGYLAPDGLRLEPVDASRVLDTRDPQRTTARALATASGSPVRVSGLAGVPAGAAAVSFNLTAVAPRADGYLTAWPCSPAHDRGRPDTSNVNYPAGVNAVANGVTVGAIDDHVCVYSHRTADVVIDVTAVWR